MKYQIITCGLILVFIAKNSFGQDQNRQLEGAQGQQMELAVGDMSIEQLRCRARCENIFFHAMTRGPLTDQERQSAIENFENCYNNCRNNPCGN